MERTTKMNKYQITVVAAFGGQKLPKPVIAKSSHAALRSIGINSSKITRWHDGGDYSTAKLGSAKSGNVMLVDAIAI